MSIINGGTMFHFSGKCFRKILRILRMDRRKCKTGPCNKDCQLEFSGQLYIDFGTFNWPDVWPLCCIYNTYNDMSKK